MSDTKKPDLLDNMIQRTDNAFAGRPDDESLIGHDLPDEEDEDLDEDDVPPARSQDPKSI